MARVDTNRQELGTSKNRCKPLIGKEADSASEGTMGRSRRIVGSRSSMKSKALSKSRLKMALSFQKDSKLLLRKTQIRSSFKLPKVK